MFLFIFFMKLKIGVMGSSEKLRDNILKEKAREVGREIARNNSRNWWNTPRSPGV